MAQKLLYGDANRETKKELAKKREEMTEGIKKKSKYLFRTQFKLFI